MEAIRPKLAYGSSQLIIRMPIKKNESITKTNIGKRIRFKAFLNFLLLFLKGNRRLMNETASCIIPKGQKTEQYTRPEKRVNSITTMNPAARSPGNTRNFNNEGKNWKKVVD